MSSEKSGQPQPQQPQPVFVQGQPVYYPAVTPQGQVPAAPQQLVYYPPPNYNQTVPSAPTAGAPQYANVVVSNTVPRYSCKIVCPNCKKEVDTIVSVENSTLVWVLCIILFIFTGICCFIPFLISSLKEYVHYCPSCRREIARKKRN